MKKSQVQPDYFVLLKVHLYSQTMALLLFFLLLFY